MSIRKGAVIMGILAIVAGVSVCVAALAVKGFDARKFSNIEYVKNWYDMPADFDNIDIKGSVEHINFVPAEDGLCRICCYEDSKNLHQIKVEDNTLVITNGEDERKWYDYIFMWGQDGDPSITVYLPKKEYKELKVKGATGKTEVAADFFFENIDITLSTGNILCYASAKEEIKLKTSTGDVLLERVGCENMSLTTSTGRIQGKELTVAEVLETKNSTGKATLSEVTCHTLHSKGSTGSLVLKQVVATGDMELKRSTGSISFEDCDAENITAETDTGSIKGSLLSGKSFSAHSDTGSVSVPESTEGGTCKLKSDTGSIHITVR